MKLKVILAMLVLFGSNLLSAQVYRLNQYYRTIHSLPQPYQGKLEITETQVIFTAYEDKNGTLDSTVTSEKIIKNKGYYIKTVTQQGAVNYEITLSSDKKEKAAGIYIISMLFAGNNGSRYTMFYKGVLAP